MQYVRRTDPHSELDNFITTPASKLDGQVLFVVGDQGMGKSALLRGFAKEMSEQGHVLAIGEIDKNNSNFSEQVYPLIAQVKVEEKIKFGSGSNWLKAGLTIATLGADIVLPGSGTLTKGAIGLGKLLVGIRESHKESGSAELSLAAIFHKELAEREKSIGDEERIIILLDPEKESPKDMISLIRNISGMGMPKSVRFVIAQRKDDELISACDRGDLHGFCHKPLELDFLTPDEEQQYVEAYDSAGRLDANVRTALTKKYDRWALLLELAVTELLKQEEEITTEDVGRLPADIRGFWKQRYEAVHDENVLKLIYVVSLLPHPYSRERLAGFTGLEPSAIAVSLNDPALKALLNRVDYEETFTQELWKGCPYPMHASAKDFIREKVEEDTALKDEILSHILTHYTEVIGEDLSGGGVDKDALISLPQFLHDNGRVEEFLSAVDQLGQIKHRYGLLDSYLADLQVALALYKELGNKKGMADQYVCMGIVYKTRGELDKALDMHGQALAIEVELGRKEGMASCYGNMGNVYGLRGEQDKALEMYGQALALEVELGRKKGVSLCYGNMGIVYQTQGELDKALDMQKKSLAINKELGCEEGMALDYGNIGNTYRVLGELGKALEMYEMALPIDKERGHKNGMAVRYANMGLLYKELGELTKACKCWHASLELYKEIGIKEEVLSLESWIAENCI